MPIVGFNFDKIVVEKKGPITGQVKVKNDMMIKTVDQSWFLAARRRKRC